MKPAEEIRALADLKSARADLAEMETLLLEVIARDDQEVPQIHDHTGPAFDPVHKAVRAICGDIAKSASFASNAVSKSKFLLTHVPESSVPAVERHCAACGQRVAGYPRNGLCGACARSYDRLRKENPSLDHGSFVIYRREHQLGLVADDVAVVADDDATSDLEL